MIIPPYLKKTVLLVYSAMGVEFFSNNEASTEHQQERITQRPIIQTDCLQPVFLFCLNLKFYEIPLFIKTKTRLLYLKVDRL